MNLETLKAILVDEFDATEKDGAIELTGARRVTIFVTFGQEALRVQKVRSVKITDKYAAIIGETEHLYVDADHQFAVKADSEDRREDARPGFH